MKKYVPCTHLIILVLTLICLSSLLALAADTAPVIWKNKQNYVQTGRIIVAADPRLFTTMAIFNSVYDYDKENSPAMYPLRAKVRAELDKRLKSVPQKKLAQWKKAKKDVHIYNYIFYTMSLSGEYPFKRVLPYPGNWWASLRERFFGVYGFEKIMNDFWVTMKLDTLWKEVYPEYLAEVKRFNINRINKEEGYIWEYVRLPKNKNGKNLVSIPNPLDTQWSAFSVEYEDYFFMVSSPGSHDYGLNIHEYLHGVAGPIVEKYYAKYKDKLRPYLEANRSKPIIRDNYNSLEGFIEENLVRAMDLRISVVYQLSELTTVRYQIDSQTKEGFNLLLPFYNLLQEYEESMNKNFDQFLPQIFDQVPYFK